MTKSLGIHFLTAEQLDEHVAKHDILKVFDDVLADTNQRVEIITHQDHFEAKIKPGTTDMRPSEILDECWLEEKVYNFAWSYIYQLRKTLDAWQPFSTIPTDGTTILVKQGGTIGAFYYEDRPDKLFYDDGKPRKPHWRGIRLLSQLGGATMHHAGGEVTPFDERLLEVIGLDEDDCPVMWRSPPSFAE